jgi:integrase
LRDLLNRFLTAKKHLVDSGELAARTWGDYKGTCDRISAAFGLSRLVVDLATDDFEKLRAQLTKRLGPVALGNEIQRVRTVFKFAFNASCIDRPVRFGPHFRRPSQKPLRKARHARGVRMFEAEELHKVLAAAGVQMKAMILLGVNCGFGNADCGTLPLSALDLECGWVHFPRPKTGIDRRCPLWPETVEALRAALAKRPTPKGEAHTQLVFITAKGGSWFKVGASPDSLMARPKAKRQIDNPLSKEMAKTLKATELRRSGLNFYALRHTCETIGGEAKDQVALDHIMGHVRDDMGSVYRERISDERLQAVTGHVRRWLFDLPEPGKANGKGQPVSVWMDAEGNPVPEGTPGARLHVSCRRPSLDPESALHRLP